MMMAPDSTPNRPKLDPASVAALESALQQYFADESQVATLLPALQRIAGEARDKAIPAEQLLVLLKDVWYGLTQVRVTPDIDKQNRLLQRVVTLCIREYYSS